MKSVKLLSSCADERSAILDLILTGSLSEYHDPVFALAYSVNASVLLLQRALATIEDTGTTA